MNYSSLISMMTKASTYDPDAQLFFNAQTAAGVTLTTTQKNAVNQWVVDAKAAGIWTKFKAIYPMVGGTATAHKFNLKNPLDTNAAFRLSFIGGGTHSSNGYLPNGTNAYANTFLIPSTSLTSSNNHLSVYNRTNTAASVGIDIGSYSAGSPILYCSFYSRFTGDLFILANGNSSFPSVANANSQGMYIMSKLSASNTSGYKNNTKVINAAASGAGISSQPLFIGAQNNTGVAGNFNNRELAFSTIGDGLTDLESQLFYQITEKYQVALGRNVNALQSFYYNPAYNNETNAFLFSTQITDNTIQTATNTLVTDLKTAGVFTKMKALYPMVGGTATTHKFNLVNAQDSAAAFALSFVGGWTHSANGALPNGTNAYANTFFIPSVNGMSLNSAHISYYSRTNTSAYMVEMGNYDAATNSSTLLLLRNVNTASIRMNNLTLIDYSNTDSLGLHISNRTASNVITGWKNGIKKITSAVASTVLPANPIYIGAFRDGTGTNYYSDKQCAFASIGDGLSDAEALAFYNAVNTFQVSLARNV